MTTPHASWATVYDLVYKESFGEFYDALANTTIEQIQNVVQPPARIVDFGAGTGRLSIPLAESGYKVVAVEPCQKMFDQLQGKPGGQAIPGFIGKIEDFQADSTFDMAICVFTVLLYLLDETSLKSSFKAAYDSLRPGGVMLVDIPSRGIFNSFQRDSGMVQREVTVTSGRDDLFLYEEKSTLTHDGRMTLYTDRFDIRYWDTDKVLQVLSETGFSVKNDLSSVFMGSGSRYFLMEKQPSL